MARLAELFGAHARESRHGRSTAGTTRPDGRSPASVPILGPPPAFRPVRVSTLRALRRRLQSGALDSLEGAEHPRSERRQWAHFDYDLLVIGCGPGGQKAAIAAAKLGSALRWWKSATWSVGCASTRGPSPPNRFARGGPVPDRALATRPLRAELPGEREHHHGRPVPA